MQLFGTIVINVWWNWAQRNEDCFGSEIFHREDFTQEFDFEKNLALFDKRLVFEEISASNQPDVIRLVDHNRRKTTPVPAFEGSEPKYRNDQVIFQFYSKKSLLNYGSIVWSSAMSNHI